MTDVVEPSNDRVPADPSVARARQRAGGRESYVAESSEPLLKDEAGDFNANDALGAGADNEFSQTSSGSSFDVTIDGGEAVVEGAILARDTQTTVTLASSANNQTVYLGYDRDLNDTVIIGLDSAFAAEDRRMPIFDFDTDGSGVTSVTDRRQLGALAIGEGATAEGGDLATAYGRNATAAEVAATALGEEATASGSAATVLGQDATASGLRASALGTNTVASQIDATAVGGNADATHDEATAIGTNAATAAANEGVLGVPVGNRGTYDWRVPGTLTVETEFSVPVLGSDPSGASDGDIWYNSTEDEYRGVENGTKVSFDTTQV
jgi:hypothetical protein